MTKNLQLIFMMMICLAFAGALSGCGKTDSSRAQIVYYHSMDDKADAILENERLVLTVSGTNTGIVLKDKQTGVVWNSVPEGADEDALADVSTRKAMKSPLLLKYEDEKGNSLTYDAFTYAVEGKTFEIEQNDGRITVRYMVGTAKRSYIIPEAVYEERFVDLMGKMEDQDRFFVMRNYLKINIENVKDAEKKSAYLKAIPSLAEGPMYVLPHILPGGVRLKEYQLVQLEDIFRKISYTQEDYEQDHVEEEESGESAVCFNVTLVYSLEKDGLRVDVPLSELRYPKEHPITEIRVLPYLMHADAEDRGYLLIPDGGGAQIDFHNGKAANSSYYADVFGYDDALEREYRIQDTHAAFPVFAIAKNENYLMGIITEGAADTGIEADVGGKRSDYDYVRPVLKIVHGEDMDISEKSVSTVKVFQEKLPDETFSVYYVSGEGTSYAQMAVRYRDYLRMAYPGALEKTVSGTPLVLEFVGAIDHIEKAAGIPVHRTYVASDCSEVTAAVEDLSEVRNLAVRYTNVMNEGEKQTALTKATLIGRLGGKKAFSELAETIGSHGGKLFLGAYVEEVRAEKLFDSFSPYRDAIRDITNTVITRYPYHVDTLAENKGRSTSIRLLSAEAQKKAFAALLKTGTETGAGVSYLDAGKLLYSDLGSRSFTSRSAFALLQKEQIGTAARSHGGVLIDGGNEYAAVQADYVVNLDVQGSLYDIVDRQIPFYEIALHGFVAYTGKAINTEGNPALSVLKAVETGAGLYYRFFETDYREIRYNSVTYSETLYGANFADWKDELLRDYMRMEKETGNLYSLRIIDHEYLADGITRTVYEDGTAVIVNYTDSDYSFGQVRVPARDYAVVRKGE